MPPPATVNLLAAVNCTGAASSSAACRAVQSSAPAAVLSKLAVAVGLLVGAVMV